jgi:hypothetical protein
MKQKNIPGIERKLQHEGITEKIADELTLSELNSFNLEIFRRIARQVSPASLMANYSSNRFVRPSVLDPLVLLNLKKLILEKARHFGFIPLELSPLAPLATCSALAPVDQNNVVSATRGTEALSDITNLLSLEAALRKKENKTGEVELCACHRTVRGQSFNNPKFSAHFELFGMVTAGRDKGNFQFERDTLLKHIRFYLELVESITDKPKLRIRLIPVAAKNGEVKPFWKICPIIQNTLEEYAVEIDTEKLNFTYYRDLRFNIILNHGGEEHMIIDGGFTDWTSQLLNNKKERILTSGMGVEYLVKIMNPVV